MAKNKIIKDENGEDCYPLTLETNVYDGQGVTIPNKYATKQELTTYAQKTDLTQIVDIGSLQYDFGGKILPAISVANSTTIYNAYTSGKAVILKWSLYGSYNYLNVLSADLIAGTYSFDILVHNEYHIAYSWTSASTGNAEMEVKGATPSNPNLLINGDFKVNQRGQETYTGNNKYSVDRWKIVGSGLSVTKLDKGINLKNVGSWSYLNYMFEDKDWKTLLGKTITISMYVSRIVSNYNTYFQISTVTGESATAIRISETGLHSFTYTVPLNAAKLDLRICYTTSGTSIDVDMDIDFVKVEIGSVATPFSPRPYGEELALCQRYYQVFKPDANTGYFAIGGLVISNTFEFMLTLPTSLRITPTITNTGSLRIWGYNIDITSSSFTFVTPRLTNANIFFSIQSTSTVTGNIVYLRANSDANAKIEIDAEIY